MSFGQYCGYKVYPPPFIRWGVPRCRSKPLLYSFISFVLETLK